MEHVGFTPWTFKLQDMIVSGVILVLNITRLHPNRPIGRIIGVCIAQCRFAVDHLVRIGQGYGNMITSVVIRDDSDLNP